MRATAVTGTGTAGLRGLLFDKDGTLFDFYATWGNWTRELIADLSRGEALRARRLAAVLRFDIASCLFDKSSPAIAGTLDDIVDTIRRALPEVSPEALRADLARRAALVTPVEAVPLAPLLDRLQGEGYTLGVVTNDSAAAARIQIGGAGVLDRFDFIAGYDSGFGGKPEPGMMHAFCRATRLRPAEVAMIGDSLHDLRPARAIGMRTVAVLTGPAEAADLAAHADAVLPDIGALPAWLAGEF